MAARRNPVKRNFHLVFPLNHTRENVKCDPAIIIKVAALAAAATALVMVWGS
jgi:hypothetical protein